MRSLVDHEERFDREHVYKLCDEIARQYSHEPPDVIIGLARGGFDIASRVSRLLRVPRVIGLPVYKDDRGVRHLDPIVQLAYEHIAGKRVLGLDDTTITGELYRKLHNMVHVLDCAEFWFTALVGVGNYTRAPELSVILNFRSRHGFSGKTVSRINCRPTARANIAQAVGRAPSAICRTP